MSHRNGFLGWDGPTEEAFERATWQFEGELDEAIDEFVGEST